MAWSQNLTHLRDWFADRYYLPDDARRVVSQAGLDPKFIAFSPQAVTNWFNILTYADHQQKVHTLIDVAVQEHPAEQPTLLAAKAGVLTGISGADIHTRVDWQGPDDGAVLEKIIGRRSSLLPIHFLEVGMARARAVVRVQTPDGGSGSGFLTQDDVLITNHHVLPTADQAAGSVIQCNYQLTPALMPAPAQTYELAPQAVFATSAEHDWSAVRVAGNPTEEWGLLPLARANPRKNDWLNIVQHPDGGPKQIALYDNPIVFVNDDLVQYLTDTRPGSSGSPAFDSEWNVVALHHSGGWLREPGTFERYYRNEGIHINRVIQGLEEAGLL